MTTMHINFNIEMITTSACSYSLYKLIKLNATKDNLQKLLSLKVRPFYLQIPARSSPSTAKATRNRLDANNINVIFSYFMVASDLDEILMGLTELCKRGVNVK